eukprot:TRINITY_DN50000_c0_g1_i1.p1 TRINITY_DN50000_c0_g1~~TRINITY_DN50000_c0_g1_i1.p1  ORF type:complete len:293 (-),score=67.09 TRINITY_DN50000_c0_g1_i1:207-1085(-)
MGSQTCCCRDAGDAAQEQSIDDGPNSTRKNHLSPSKHIAIGKVSMAAKSDEELKAFFETLVTEDTISRKEWMSALDDKDMLFCERMLPPGRDEDLLTIEVILAEKAAYMVACKIAHTMDSDEGTTGMKILFEQLDMDSSNSISAKEFCSGLMNSRISDMIFGSTKPTLHELMAAFARFDVDSSGTLSWEELEEAVCIYSASEQLAAALYSDEDKAELKRLFISLDKNNDNKISPTEWGSAIFSHKELMNKLFGATNRRAIIQMFEQLDKDHSGGLDWDEFEAASKKRRRRQE